MPNYREWDLSCKVYVGNLGTTASKHELESAFTKYGPLRNVWVARNPPGFAFIEFEDPRDAEDSVRGLDGTRLCGTRVRVEMSSGRTRRTTRPGAPRKPANGRYDSNICKLNSINSGIAKVTTFLFFGVKWFDEVRNKIENICGKNSRSPPPRRSPFIRMSRSRSASRER